MPAPSDKTGRSQLNVWVKKPTIDFIKQYATRKGFTIGQATERLILIAKTHLEEISGETNED